MKTHTDSREKMGDAWWIRLGWIARIGKSWIAAAIVFFIIALVASASVHVAAAGKLSPGQADEEHLGSYGAALSVSIQPSDNKTLSTHVAEGIPAVMSQLSISRWSVILCVLGLPSGTHGVALGLAEASWSESTFPERYNLVEGAWPRTSAEIVVSERSDYHRGDTVSVYGGLVRYQVVGIYRDWYIPDTNVALAGPGATDQLFSTLAASGKRFDLPTQIIGIRADVTDVSQFEKAIASHLAATQHEPLEVAQEQVFHMTMVKKNLPWTWSIALDKLPPYAGWGPLVLLPALVSLLMSARGLPRQRRILSQLHKIGLPTFLPLVSGNICWAALVTLAVGVGAAAGQGVGYYLRHPILAHVDHPLSPVMPVAPIAVIPVVAALLGVVSVWALDGVLMLKSLCLPGFERWRKSVRRIIVPAQWLLIVAGVAWASSQLISGGASTTKGLTRWALVVCAIISMIVGVAISTLSDRAGRYPLPFTLALRRSHRTRAVTFCLAAISMMVVALPTAAGISLATNEYRAIHAQTPIAAPGHIVIGINYTSHGGLPVAMQMEIENETGLRDPVVMREVLIVDPAFPQGLPLALDSVDSVERLVGHALTEDQRNAFGRGYLLVFDSPKNRVHPGAELSMVDMKTETSAGTIPTMLIGGVPEAYARGRLGVISAPYVREQGWPMNDRYVIYTAATEEQRQAVTKAPGKLGFDQRYIKVAEVPKPIAMPASLLATQASLSVLLAIVAFAAALRAALAAQPFAQTLTVIGLPKRVSHAAIYCMVLVTVAIPMLLGHGVAIWVNQWGWSKLLRDNVGATIPWADIYRSMALCCALCFTAPTLALFAAGRKGRQGRRLEE